MTSRFFLQGELTIEITHVLIVFAIWGSVDRRSSPRSFATLDGFPFQSEYRTPSRLRGAFVLSSFLNFVRSYV